MTEIDSLHHYTECGLDYVYLANGFTVHDTPYGRAVEVANASQLDRQIAEVIVKSQGPLQGQEVRFLRGLLDLTQQELASLMGKGEQSVARWERSKTAIPPTESIALRQIYLERTGRTPRFTETSKMASTLKSRIEHATFREAKPGSWVWQRSETQGEAHSH